MIENIDFNIFPTEAQANLSQLITSLADLVPVETNTWEFSISMLQPGAELPAIVLDVTRWAVKGYRYLYLWAICRPETRFAGSSLSQKLKYVLSRFHLKRDL